MLDLPGALALCERHIQGDPRDDRLPGLILRQSLSLDGAPEKDNLLFRHVLEKVLLAFMEGRGCRVISHTVNWIPLL